MVAKGLCVRGELETEQNCNILTPPALLAIAALLSRSPKLLDRGPWGPQALSLELVLTLASYLQNSDSNFKLQTNWTSCRTGLYHCLTPTCLLWASHLYRIQPVQSQGYTLISSNGCTCSLIDGWVNMLQMVSILPLNFDSSSLHSMSLRTTPRTACSTVFLVLLQGPSICLVLFYSLRVFHIN